MDPETHPEKVLTFPFPFTEAVKVVCVERMTAAAVCQLANPLTSEVRILPEP